MAKENLKCPYCQCRHFIIKTHPDGTNLKDVIECGGCGKTWQSGSDAEPYASGKFSEDRRKK